jgi:hypothetical protein
LEQRADDLPAFLGAVLSSPILLPFDATSTELRSLWTQDPVDTFPPPMACFPNLTDAQSEMLNAVETEVFGLPPESKALNLDPACFGSRPVYGILDLLRLRLPFPDANQNTPRQALTLGGDVRPRATFHFSQTVAPFSSGAVVNGSSVPDVKDYGTFNHLNHVVYDYLSSLPSTNVAQELIKFLLSSPSGPPDSNSSLGKSVTSIVPIEAAVFGKILPEDVSTVSSSFSSHDNSLFFGSSAADDLRDWAISNGSHTLIWAEDAMSSKVARDKKDNETFEKIWSVAATAIQKTVANVSASNVTSSLDANGLLSS